MKVDVTFVKGSVKFTLLEPVEINGWDVPAGYTTDGASICRWLWWFCCPCEYLAIFAWHDWAYEHATLPRWFIDLELREMLLCAGMSRFRAWTIYIAVRFFGQSHFLAKTMPY